MAWSMPTGGGARRPARPPPAGRSDRTGARSINGAASQVHKRPRWRAAIGFARVSALQYREPPLLGYGFVVGLGSLLSQRVFSKDRTAAGGSPYAPPSPRALVDRRDLRAARVSAPRSPSPTRSTTSRRKQPRSKHRSTENGRKLDALNEKINDATIALEAANEAIAQADAVSPPRRPRRPSSAPMSPRRAADVYMSGGAARTALRSSTRPRRRDLSSSQKYSQRRGSARQAPAHRSAALT